MRAHATRQAIVMSSAALLMLGLASCSQQPSGGSDSAKGTSAAQSGTAAPNDLKIVEQVQIDNNGAAVAATAGTAPADPAGAG